MDYFPRYLSSFLVQASCTFPVVLLTGPRQTGKSTLLEHCLADGRTAVTLDDPALRDAARRDPALFFKTYPPPILIDEVQYAPQLFPYIKMIVDREKQNGLFWLTGSHVFNLMNNVSESLAGRAAVLYLQGFSRGEKLRIPVEQSLPFVPSFELRSAVQPQTQTIAQMYTAIWRGSFPKLTAEPETSWRLFYDSYLATYIEKDIRISGGVRDEHAFLQFLRVAASRTSQLLNYSTIARDIDVSVNTVKSWVSLLETSGLAYLLYPYSGNFTARLTKTPKLHFLDTGLACYLAGWPSADLLQNGAMNGAILESYVVAEILKSYWHHGERPNVYFYRDHDQREIDLLIERDGVLYPVEIKRSASPSSQDIRHFNTLKSSGRNIGTGALLCLVDAPVPLREDAVALPIGYVS